MTDLNYHHLRYFRAVAHRGNLTQAARSLNLSQSALSVQVRHLERRLGHDLFERRGRALHLTEAGRVVLDHADAIFSAGEELVASLGSLESRRRPLHVGALPTLSRNFQLDFLLPLIGREDVELVLHSGSDQMLLDALATLNLDVVLTNKPLQRDVAPSLLTHKLADQRVSLIGTPERLGRGGPLHALLSTHPVILPTPQSSIRTAFEALASRLDVDLRIAAEADDMAMLRLLARQDVGIAVLPPIVVKDELETDLLRIAHELPGVTENFYAITVKRRFPNPTLADLLDNRGGTTLDAGTGDQDSVRTQALNS